MSLNLGLQDIFSQANLLNFDDSSMFLTSLNSLYHGID
jgi:hypothetical protein